MYILNTQWSRTLSYTSQKHGHWQK